MSDDLTEAVKRLLELKEDVERLKGATDEEGEVRILRVVQDDTTTGEAVNSRLNDAEVTDGTETGDSVTSSSVQASPGEWDADDWDDTLEWG